jgi:hypothetical protein
MFTREKIFGFTVISVLLITLVFGAPAGTAPPSPEKPELPLMSDSFKLHAESKRMISELATGQFMRDREPVA